MQITDVIVDKLSVNDPFEVNCPSNVFPPKRAMKHMVLKEALSPLRLPDYTDQCVHVEMEGASLGYERCLHDANGRCGWLCKEHDESLLNPHGPRGSQRTNDEIVDHIKATEARALRGAALSKVRLTAKGDTITYVINDVR